MTLQRVLQAFMLVALLHSGVGWTATYWVSKQGSDTNSCFASEARPNLATQSKRTIMAGAACLRLGDTLMVMPGDYNEWLETPLPSGGTLRSADSNPANWFVLKPQNNVIPNNTAAIRFNSSRPNVTLKYMKIDLSSIASGNKVSHCLSAGNNDVSNLVLEDFECIGPAPGMAGDTGSGITMSGGNGWIVRRGVIKNFINASGSPGAHGIYLQNNDALVEYVWIENVNGHCVNMRRSGAQTNNIWRYNVCKGPMSGGHISNSGSGSGNHLVHNNIWWNSGRINVNNDGNSIFNNTIYSGSTHNCIRLRGSNHVVQNNIFLNCGSTPILNESGGSTVSYNLTSGTPSKIFADYSNGDFRLVGGSPAIDAGTTISGVNRDFAGTSRPQGCCYDIGAFEYILSGSAPMPPTNVDITANQ